MRIRIQDAPLAGTMGAVAGDAVAVGNRVALMLLGKNGLVGLMAGFA